MAEWLSCSSSHHSPTRAVAAITESVLPGCHDETIKDVEIVPCRALDFATGSATAEVTGFGEDRRRPDRGEPVDAGGQLSKVRLACAGDDPGLLLLISRLEHLRGIVDPLAAASVQAGLRRLLAVSSH
jgi:hypothetical protein